MLNFSDKEKLIAEFPNIKLSYENIMHKKVYPNEKNFILAIPEGKKCFAWFTNYNNKNSCFVLEHGKKYHNVNNYNNYNNYNNNNNNNNNNNKIEDIKIFNCCFNYELCFGTIFYGTLFNYNKNNFFTIEDVYYYKSSNVSDLTWFNKLELINNIMSHDIKQVSYNKNFLVFGVPLIYENFEEFHKNISSIKYKINCAQFRYYNKSNISYNLLFDNINNYNSLNDYNHNKNEIKDKNNKKIINNTNNTNNTNNNFDTTKNINTIQAQNKENKNLPHENNYKINLKRETLNKREIVFQVRPDLQNDIYHLYCIDNNLNLINYDIAFIPDFKTSVMMNKLFRNIKENINLDSLEESDDEEEFENEKEDRFVFLDKKYNMVCNYNHKFKKWYPIKIVDSENQNKIIHKKDLLVYEKNKH